MCAHMLTLVLIRHHAVCFSCARTFALRIQFLRFGRGRRVGVLSFRSPVFRWPIVATHGVDLTAWTINWAQVFRRQSWRKPWTKQHQLLKYNCRLKNLVLMIPFYFRWCPCVCSYDSVLFPMMSVCYDSVLFPMIWFRFISDDVRVCVLMIPFYFRWCPCVCARQNTQHSIYRYNIFYVPNPVYALQDEEIVRNTAFIYNQSGILFTCTFKMIDASQHEGVA